MSSGDASSDKEGSLKPKLKGRGAVSPKGFLVQVTGRIESAQIFGANDIYCKYNLAMGGDWAVAAVPTTIKML